MVAASLLYGAVASADITWTWSFGTESAIFLTNGELNVGGIAPAGPYTLLDFEVTESVDSNLIGSLSGGEYMELDPGQGFLWDGAVDTQWMRRGGFYSDGANFSSTVADRRYFFDDGGYGSFTLRNGSGDTTYATGTRHLEPLPWLVWSWSFATEAGTLLTDGALAESGGAPTGSYRILGFSVSESVDSNLIGSLSGGEYVQVQPAQGFVWDGTSDTEWYRADGQYTDGAGFSSAVEERRYLFYPGIYALRNDFGTVTYAYGATMSLVPLPEPSRVSVSLAAVCTLLGLVILHRR